ncbi:MAG TPA: serine/threonine-protein kinase [Gemmatimonadaceae bacterium]
MSADEHDNSDDLSPPPNASEEERAMRDAQARALAESGLGSGLLARQSTPADEEPVAVFKVCPHCGTEYETTARFCPSDGTALRPKGADSLIGRVLADRYHILKRIGEGGMGRVYLGEHVKMNRQCAIKVMSPALVNDAESAARFAREASNAARIIHPNVAAVFDYGESDGLIYLVMEFVDGEPLARVLTREAPLALDRALDLASQIADGLGAAHELGIVHRDLKPDNILVSRTRTGREIAKVVDFGIAKAIQEGVGEGLTHTGQVIGTPEFMSPEQLLGDPVDARSDLYALGCILYLMLTASPPFDAPTREQMIKRRLSEDAPHVHEIDPALPDSVARIVARLLARSPKERYGSAAEVKDALAGAHVRRSGVVRAPLESLPTLHSAPTVAFLHATQATTEVTEIPESKPMRRTPIVIGGAAVATIAIALVLRGRPSPVDTERLDSITKDSVVAAAIAASHIDTVAPARDSTAAVTAPVPMVDTARLNVRLTQKRAHDSVARITDLNTTAVRRAIVRYAHAIESGNIATLRSAYPAMTPQQQDNWEKTFFARADKIAAPIRYGATRIARDTAEADFTLLLNILTKDTKQSVSSPLKQHAKLVRHGTSWQIVSLK